MLKEVSPIYNILGSTSISGTTSVTSSASWILYKDTIEYQCNLSGTPIGTIFINGSIDYNPGLPQTGMPIRPGNWASITSLAISSGTLSPVIFNLTQIGVPYTQLQFVSSTSSGTFDVWFCAKSLG